MQSVSEVKLMKKGAQKKKEWLAKDIIQNPRPELDSQRGDIEIFIGDSHLPFLCLSFPLFIQSQLLLRNFD